MPGVSKREGRRRKRNQGMRARDLRGNQVRLMLGKLWERAVRRQLPSERSKMRVGRSQFCLSRDLVLCPPWKTHSIVRTTPVWKGHESECVWICLGSFESTHWDTDLIGANGRPCPTHGFLSSLSSWCFPGVCPSPSKALRRPSSGTCASDGQAPGERGSLSFWRS